MGNHVKLYGGEWEVTEEDFLNSCPFCKSYFITTKTEDGMKFNWPYPPILHIVKGVLEYISRKEEE